MYHTKNNMSRREIEIYSHASSIGVAPKIASIAKNSITSLAGRSLFYEKNKIQHKEQLINLVKTLHSAGIYHLDLYPRNIVIIDNHCKLIDFGQSRYKKSLSNYEYNCFVSSYKSFITRLCCENNLLPMLGETLEELEINMMILSLTYVIIY